MSRTLAAIKYVGSPVFEAIESAFGLIKILPMLDRMRPFPPLSAISWKDSPSKFLVDGLYLLACGLAEYHTSFVRAA